RGGGVPVWGIAAGLSARGPPGAARRVARAGRHHRTGGDGAATPLSLGGGTERVQRRLPAPPDARLAVRAGGPCRLPGAGLKSRAILPGTLSAEMLSPQEVDYVLRRAAEIDNGSTETRPDHDGANDAALT